MSRRGSPPVDASQAADSPPPPPPEAFGYYSICDRHLGFRNRANGSYHAHLFPGKPLSTTDEFGFRNGVGWSAKGTAPIVLFVGDSFTFCSEVPDDQTGPSEVAKLLRKEFDVRVLNAGVRGYSLLQVKRMTAECLERFPNINVVVYTHCGNDLEESLVADVQYPALAPVVVEDRQTGQFSEVEVAHPAVPWGENFLTWRPACPPPSRWSHVAAWLHVHSALCHHCLLTLERYFARCPSRDKPMQQVEPPDLPINRMHWHDWAKTKRHGDKIMCKLLADMRENCRSHGAELLVTSVYTGLDKSTPKESRDCAQVGVPYMSLVEHFPLSSAAYTAVRCDGRYDPHYNATGTKTYAAALAPTLLEVLRNRLPKSAVRQTDVSQGKIP